MTSSQKPAEAVTNVFLIGSQEYLGQNVGSTLSRFITENKRRRILYVGHADHKVFTMSRLLKQKFASQSFVIESYWKNGTPCPDWLFDASFAPLVICTTCQNAISWFSQDSENVKFSIFDFEVLVLDDAVQLVDSNSAMSMLLNMLTKGASPTMPLPTFMAVSSSIDAKLEETDAVFKFGQVYRALNIQRLLIATGAGANVQSAAIATSAAQLKPAQFVPVRLTEGERAIQLEMSTVLGIIKRTVLDRYSIVLDQISQDHLRHLIWYAKSAQLPTLEFYLQLYRNYQVVYGVAEALPPVLVLQALDAVFIQVSKEVKAPYIEQQDGEILYSKSSKISSEADIYHFTAMKQYFLTEFNKWRQTIGKGYPPVLNAKFEPMLNVLGNTKAGELNLVVVHNDAVYNFLLHELGVKLNALPWKNEDYGKYVDRSMRGAWQTSHTYVFIIYLSLLIDFYAQETPFCMPR